MKEFLFSRFLFIGLILLVSLHFFPDFLEVAFDLDRVQDEVGDQRHPRPGRGRPRVLEVGAKFIAVVNRNGDFGAFIRYVLFAVTKCQNPGDENEENDEKEN